ncbi:MAG: CHAP domain-containing protein [Clostridia bacterium]|nr:CHAP domain-containing protein [Clostridia bacterium]
MNYEEFIKKYNGKATDYDGGYGVQCVDLIKLYLDKVFNIKIGAIGNAEAYYRRYNEIPDLRNNFTRIAYSKGFNFQKGDIVVWGTGLSQYGHIAIATGEGNSFYFYSYDQNWNGKEMRKTNHSYTYLSGILRPKDQSKINQNEILDIFDTDLYNSSYLDLQEAFRGSEQQLRSHFLTCGLKEGRRGSYVFDGPYYLNKYSDLKKVFGNDYTRAYEHFIKNGIYEGRQASAELDVVFYKNANSDLKNMSNIEALKHFLNHGINEGRASSSGFYILAYKNKYEDLRKKFGNNNKEYMKHYIQFGIKEGRRC